MVWYNPKTWFKDRRINHDFNAEDRETAAEIRRYKLDLKKEELRLQSEISKRQQELKIRELEDQIAEFEDEGDDEGDDNPDTMLLKMFAPILLSKMNTPPQPAPVATSTPATIEYSRERIVEIYDALPSYAKKMAKKMSDDELRNLIISKIPNISKPSIETALEIVRHS